MREKIAMREIIANVEGAREVKAKCVSLLQNAGDLATMLNQYYYFPKFIFYGPLDLVHAKCPKPGRFLRVVISVIR